MKTCILMVLFLLSLVGCNSTAPTGATLVLPDTLSLIDHHDFGPKPYIADPRQLFELTATAGQAFLDYYYNHENRHVAGHRRLYNYLLKRLHQFNYYSDTYSAQQVIDNQSGNCISLAILTTAYAKLANIQISYHHMSAAPIYTTDGKFEFASSHVVTKLQDPDFTPKSGVFYVTKPRIIVDYFPVKDSWLGGRVSDSTFVAMYYQNMASDALAWGQYYHAAWLAAKALTLVPNDVSSINLMAVIYRHLGHQSKAEALYQQGLAIKPSDLMLLTNYHILLTAQNRSEAADKIKIALDNADDPSPFRWLKLADEALARQQLTRALRLYHKVIEKAHYLPQGYAGVAKVAYLQQHHKKSKHYLKMAIQRTHDDKTESLYQAKLALLVGQ